MKLKQVEEIAKKLDVSVETVLGWRDLGMPWVKIGKMVFILEDSFHRWAKQLEKAKNVQDAPEQDFFGRPIGEAVPPKS